MKKILAQFMNITFVYYISLANLLVYLGIRMKKN